MRGDIERIGTFFVEAVEKVNSRINVLMEVYLDHIEGLDGRAIPSSPFVGVQFLMKGYVVLLRSREERKYFLMRQYQSPHLSAEPKL